MKNINVLIAACGTLALGPSLVKLVKDLEKSRDELDKHIKTKSSLSKSEKQALKRGEWPFK